MMFNKRKFLSCVIFMCTCTNALCTCYALVHVHKHVTLILAGANNYCLVPRPHHVPGVGSGNETRLRLHTYIHIRSNVHVQCQVYNVYVDAPNFKSYADAAPLNLSYACVAHSWQFQLSKISDENHAPYQYE